MKLTQMIHDTVVAFKPDRHPVAALIALAMMLIALVSLFVAAACLGGTGAGALVTLVSGAAVRLRHTR